MGSSRAVLRKPDFPSAPKSQRVENPRSAPAAYSTKQRCEIIAGVLGHRSVAAKSMSQSVSPRCPPKTLQDKELYPRRSTGSEEAEVEARLLAYPPQKIGGTVPSPNISGFGLTFSHRDPFLCNVQAMSSLFNHDNSSAPHGLSLVPLL